MRPDRFRKTENEPGGRVNGVPLYPARGTVLKPVAPEDVYSDEGTEVRLSFVSRTSLREVTPLKEKSGFRKSRTSFDTHHARTSSAW